MPGLVVMELLQGCENRSEQRKLEKRLDGYQVYWTTEADCNRALQSFASYHLSHQVGILDALISETAIGLGVSLATFNTKHYNVLKALQTIQPYEKVDAQT